MRWIANSWWPMISAFVSRPLHREEYYRRIKECLTQALGMPEATR